ncbi:hypothetical protein EVAR_43415_1 [Eumeta japonica]|uniref:Uncharacterized protein n=1 Tax=Eumeta variegata TaxID=151549 RepID=A0A4C1WUH7_EUMVA|nr:hypothetical protein EVAR_43415_1 [Eumeta japonica]
MVREWVTAILTHWKKDNSRKSYFTPVSCKSLRNSGSHAEPIDGVQDVAVAGGEAVLPCDTGAPQAPDALLLVVWYKDDNPVYSNRFKENSLEHLRIYVVLTALEQLTRRNCAAVRRAAGHLIASALVV